MEITKIALLLFDINQIALCQVSLFFTFIMKYFSSTLWKMSRVKSRFQVSLNPLLSLTFLISEFKTKARHQKHLISLSENINTKFYHNWQQRSKWPLTLLVKTRKDQFDTFPIRYGAISNVTEAKNCSSNVFLYHFEEEGDGIVRNFVNCRIFRLLWATNVGRYQQPFDWHYCTWEIVNVSNVNQHLQLQKWETRNSKLFKLNFWTHRLKTLLWLVVDVTIHL